jgi:hypothetical protein
MDVEMTLKRGNIDVLSFDPEFLAEFIAFLDANPEEGSVKQDSLYRRFAIARSSLIGIVSKILGKERKDSFTITIKVEGDERVFPLGPRLY